jgi:hypothetical protein
MSAMKRRLNALFTGFADLLDCPKSDRSKMMERLMSALLEVVVVFCVPLLVFLLMSAGVTTNLAVGKALVALLAVYWYFDFSTVMALMIPIT